MLVIEWINKKQVQKLLADHFSIPEKKIHFALDKIAECLTFHFSAREHDFEGWIVSRMSRVGIQAAYGYVLTLFPEGLYEPDCNTTFEAFADIDAKGMPRKDLAEHVSKNIVSGVTAVLEALDAGEQCYSEEYQQIRSALDRQNADARLFSKRGVSRHVCLPNREHL